MWAPNFAWKRHNWSQVLPLMILLALQATASAAQEAIGKATSVRPQAEGSHGGTRTLSGGSDVYSSDAAHFQPHHLLAASLAIIHMPLRDRYACKRLSRLSKACHNSKDQ